MRVAIDPTSSEGWSTPRCEKCPDIRDLGNCRWFIPSDIFGAHIPFVRAGATRGYSRARLPAGRSSHWLQENAQRRIGTLSADLGSTLRQVQRTGERARPSL